MRSREAGVSLVELLVALLVTGVTMAIAARLLIGSQYLLMAASREARDPIVEIAIRQLRNDIQGSSSVRFGGREWSSQPIELLGHQSYGSIRYERTSDLRLVRTLERDGKEISRDLLHGVVIWRWIDLGGLLSLQISIRRQVWRGDPLHPSAEVLTAQPLEELQWLSFAMRGRGKAYGW